MHRTGKRICGCSSSGRAPPCQGGGSEFEPRQPLHFLKNHISVCGCSSSGRAPPCQGGGSEFEPRQPLQIKGHRCHSVLFFYPQHTRFLHLRKIRGRGPRESLRLLRGVDASSSLVSRSKSKDTDAIRCFFFYPQHTHFLHLHKIRGRGVDASLSLVSRSKSKKHRCIRCFLFYSNRQPLLILCRFTASP